MERDETAAKHVATGLTQPCGTSAGRHPLRTNNTTFEQEWLEPRWQEIEN